MDESKTLIMIGALLILLAITTTSPYSLVQTFNLPVLFVGTMSTICFAPAAVVGLLFIIIGLKNLRKASPK